MRIGYQGEVGSNAEEASKRYSNTSILLPLTTSKNVVNELINRTIDIGILAYRNSITGEVIETKEALKELDYEILDTVEIPIHHYLFKKKNAKTIKYVASHIQALQQTRIWRSKNLSYAEEYEMIDTAIAARYLGEGLLEDTYAVICRINAGEMYNLELIASQIEDNKENKTTFIVIQLRTK